MEITAKALPTSAFPSRACNGLCESVIGVRRHVTVWRGWVGLRNLAQINNPFSCWLLPPCNAKTLPLGLVRVGDYCESVVTLARVKAFSSDDSGCFRSLSEFLVFPLCLREAVPHASDHRRK